MNRGDNPCVAVTSQANTSSAWAVELSFTDRSKTGTWVGVFPSPTTELAHYLKYLNHGMFNGFVRDIARLLYRKDIPFASSSFSTRLLCNSEAQDTTPLCNILSNNLFVYLIHRLRNTFHSRYKKNHPFNSNGYIKALIQSFKIFHNFIVLFILNLSNNFCSIALYLIFK